MLTTSNKVWRLRGAAALALFCVAGTGLALAPALAPTPGNVQDDKGPKGDPYPLDTCIVSGEKLGSMGAPITLAHEGREIKLCCNGCVKPFKENPADFIAKIDEQIIKQQLPAYPLKNCLVMDTEKLGGEDMGEPVNFVYKNRLVRFCCKSCLRQFNKKPAEFLEKLNAAVIEKQMAAYPLTHCVVLEEESLGDDAINHVFANRLVRFCCKGCVAKFDKDPLAYMARIDAALVKE